MFKQIGLITNSGVKTVQSTLNEVVNYLDANDRKVILDECCSDLLGQHNFDVFEANELGKHCDLVIAIGGDGTMLMASHILCDFNVPLLGINLGHVGFLADINVSIVNTMRMELLSIAEFIIESISSTDMKLQ